MAEMIKMETEDRGPEDMWVRGCWGWNRDMEQCPCGCFASFLPSPRLKGSNIANTPPDVERTA